MLRHAQSGVTLTDLGYRYAVDGHLTTIVDPLDPARSTAISDDALVFLRRHLR